MADAEYIEITKSEISNAKKDLNAEEAEENTGDVTSDDTSQEIEIIEDESAAVTTEGEAIDCFTNQDTDDKNASKDITLKQKDLDEDPKPDDETPSLTDEEDDFSNFQGELNQRTPSTSDHHNDTYEVINEAEENEKSEPTEGKVITENELKNPAMQSVLDEKSSSPFRRFRTFTKQDKKEQQSTTAGSSISFPSIFSDISTSFMSLKNIGKRKESHPDDTQLQNITEDSTPSPVSSVNAATVEQLRIERKNLLGMAKLSIKGLIESSLSAGHTLDSDHVPLQQFFIIMEAVLRHGLKSPKLFFAGNKQFWGPLEAIEKIGSDAAEITNSVRDLPGIKSHAGRARAWLRLALMQKRLADYFRMMVEHRDIMKEFYDPESLVLSEEGIVLSGHLVGLNCIDANLCMKGDDLDNQNAVIDYSLYMKDGNRFSVTSDLDLLLAEEEKSEEQKSEKSEVESPEEQIGKLANQKNYLEERNRYLETTLNELQKRAGHTSSSNQLLEAELEAAKISLVTMREERERLLEEREAMAEAHRKILLERQSDLDTERETLKKTQSGLDEMLNQVKSQLKQEAIMRMDVERELETQISRYQESEVAMKLLEKDIYVKQDSLVTLRGQLDEVKEINKEIYKKLQDKTEADELKSRNITDLEEETKRLNMELKKLKEKLAEAHQQLDVTIERADRFAQGLDDSEKRRNALETNLKIEREWRIALEQKEEKAANQISQLQTELSMMQLLRQELNDVKNERDELKNYSEEQESTISDLADSLGKSKQNFQDLKDVHKSFADKTWEKDKEVKDCVQCEKPFNLARRKHHCRNCGKIFCNMCSDNTMPLASSAKPVRVCDSCHTTLLQRYSAATP